MYNFDKFFQSYISCALWSSTDDNSNPLDSHFTQRDISPSTLERMKQDCTNFIRECGIDLESRSEEYGGYDFWLTRNGYGAGFWDGDWQEEVGERLTQVAHSFGSCDLYVGDDGLIYIM